jgi:hypothetical protein
VDVGDFLGKLPLWAGFAVVAAPGLWAVWKQSSADRVIARKERVDLIRIAQEVSAETIADLRRRVEELEGEVNAMRKEHTESIAAKDAELALLRGELRQAWATVDAYERLLTVNEIPHEKPAQAFWRVPPGNQPGEVSPL